MDYQPIGSKSIKKDDAISLSIFSQEGANYVYLDSIKTKDAIKTTIALNGKGSQSWRIGRDHGLVMSGSETLIATEDIVICYGVNRNILTGFVAGSANGAIDDGLGDIISISTDTTKYNLRRFEYFLDGGRYVSPEQTDVPANFNPGDNFKILMVNAQGTYFLPADNTPTPADLESSIEVGGIGTQDQSNISQIGDSTFFANKFMKNIYRWSKFVKKTNFLGSAGNISENNSFPLQIDIVGGDLIDPNLNYETIQSASRIGAVERYNISGVYKSIPKVTPYTVNVTQWDNGTDLQTLGNNKWASHTVLRSSRTGEIYIVISRAEYNNQTEAESAPFLLGGFVSGSEVEPLAKIIVQKDATSITNILNRVEPDTLTTQTPTMQSTYDNSQVPQIIMASAKPIEYRNDISNSLAVLQSWNTNSGLSAYFQITKDGFRYTPGWKDLKASFSAAKTTQQNSPTWEAWKGGIYEYSFASNGSDEIIVSPFHIDHDYSPNTGMFFHIHWSPSTNAIGTVRWGIEFTKAKGHSQEAFGSTQVVYIEESVNGQQDIHFVSEYTELFAGGNLEPDTIIKARVFRDGTHPNDTYADKVWGFMCDLHYLADRETTPQKTPNFYTYNTLS